MAEETEKEKRTDYFDDYVLEKTPRFRTIPILDDEITVRVKFTVRESAELNKLTSKFAKLLEKMNENSSEDQIKAYETSVNECIKYVVKTQEDREKVSNWILAPDPDTDDILELSDFLQIVRRAQKIDDVKAEEDSGKASSGSENS